MFKIEDKAKVQLPEPLSINQQARDQFQGAHFDYDQYIEEENYNEVDGVEHRHRENIGREFPSVKEQIEREAAYNPVI